MERLFSVLTAIAVLMILIAGTGVYLTSKIVVSSAKDEAALSSAKGIAQTLTHQIKLLESTLDKMAQDPEVIAAVMGGNQAALKSVAAKLEKYYPVAGKIRLFPVGTIEADQADVPRMGFGDLDMIKATFQGNPLPAIQGDVGPDRHLAITRRIIQGNKVVGVVLASLNYDFINPKLCKKGLSRTATLSLRQGKLVIVQHVGDNKAR